MNGAGPVYFVDLDGLNAGKPRRRVTRLVGYDREVEVARTTVHVPVSRHPSEAVNLKDPKLGLADRLREIIAEHGVTGTLTRAWARERDASLTINEYETLLMQHDHGGPAEPAEVRGRRCVA
jgi:hypothetical protein